jgi:hydroxymethylpyrimidine/phosphomethylpyrimidine kinase
MNETQKAPMVLTIAGSDPSGGAGIQGDLKTFSQLGAWGQAVVVGLTAQNTLGVTRACGVDPLFVHDQLNTLFTDEKPQAAKTGMLATAQLVEVVASFLKRAPLPLVVDPVMIATSGARLLEPDAVEKYRSQLIPLATLVTPNGPEAAVLAGKEVRSEADMVEAAHRILGMGCQAVLIKGGDMPHLRPDKVLDLLLEVGSEPVLFESPRLLPGVHASYHGSGCCLAAAAAVAFSQGRGIRDAVEKARETVAQAISGAAKRGKGAWPVNHMAIRPFS